MSIQGVSPSVSAPINPSNKKPDNSSEIRTLEKNISDLQKQITDIKNDKSIDKEDAKKRIESINKSIENIRKQIQELKNQKLETNENDKVNSNSDMSAGRANKYDKFVKNESMEY